MKRTADILLTLLLLAAGASLLTGCGDSDGDGPAEQLLEQIVTFTGNEGTDAGFEYQAVDDSPLIRLSVSGNLNEEEVKPGTRLLMRYRLPAGTPPDSDGKVSLIGLQRILTDTVAPLAGEPAQEPLYLLTIQRSGEYLNVQSQMPTGRQRSLEVSASPLPGADGLTDLYISPRYGEDGADGYLTVTWASLWIGPVWRDNACSGVRVHVANSNNIYRTEFIFKK